jgi:hypothetical protein
MTQDQQGPSQDNEARDHAEEISSNPRQFNSELAKVGKFCCPNLALVW